jgi:hypothetical protein
MSQEQLSNLNIAITAKSVSGDVEIGRIAYLAHSFELFLGQEQIVGTTPELLIIVPAVPAYVYVHNQSAYTIILDCSSAMNIFPQRIISGGSLVLAPETDTIYVRAFAENSKIWVMSVY